MKKTLVGLISMSLLALAGCGGGTDSNNAVDNSAMSLNLTQSGIIQTSAGTTISVNSNAEVRAVGSSANAKISTMAWTATQTSGNTPASGITLKLSDPNCTNIILSANLGQCKEIISIPTGIPTSTWLITANATSSNGVTDSSSFTIQVGTNPSNNLISNLVVSNLPIAGITNHVISLPASYTFANGVSVASQNISFNWTQTNGAAVVLAGQGTSTMSFIPQSSGIYGFNVVMTALINGVTQTATSDVVVNITDIPSFIISAGNIQNAIANNIVTLNGTVSNINSSSSSTATLFTYNWTQVGGPANVLLSNSNSLTTSFNPTVPGTYVFQLNVDDGVYSQNTLTEVIVAANGSFSISAGNAQIIQSVNSVVSLTGTISNGNSSSTNLTPTYSWTQISGPVNLNINNSSSSNASIIPTQTGDYVFQLSVTENGVTQTANTEVTVLGQVNPNYFYVSAGNSQSIVAQNGVYNAVTLNGVVNGGANVNNQAISYNWTQVSGPTIILSNINTATASFVPSGTGTYVFQLSATVGTVTETETATTTVLIN